MKDLETALTKLLLDTHKRLLKRGQIMPINTPHGIKVGNVLIKCNDEFKEIWHKNKIIYSDVFLSQSAIKIANIIAQNNRKTPNSDYIYDLDKTYSRARHDYETLKQHYGKVKDSEIVYAKMNAALTRLRITKSQILKLL